MTTYPVPRHILMYFAPQRVDGYQPILGINSVDFPIGAQISQYHAIIHTDGSRVLVDHAVQCQPHVRGQLFETIGRFSSKDVDLEQLQIGRVGSPTSYSVTYARSAATQADPSARSSLMSLCYEPVFDTKFIDTSPSVR